MSQIDALIDSLRIGPAPDLVREAADRLECLRLVWHPAPPRVAGWHWTRQAGRPGTACIQYILPDAEWVGYEFAGPIPLPEDRCPQT